MYPLKKFVECAIKAKKCNTGSILVYDKNNIEYFAHHSLVEKMKSKFNILLMGKELYFIYEMEVWSGAKWENKQVNSIVFIALEIESINLFLTLIKEKEDIRTKISNLNQEYDKYLNSSNDELEKFGNKLFDDIENSEALNIIFGSENKSEESYNQFKVMKIQRCNEYNSEIATLRNMLLEINNKIELMIA
jgi:hypothetical protein